VVSANVSMPTRFETFIRKTSIRFLRYLHLPAGSRKKLRNG
jgi:hypothetical protein